MLLLLLSESKQLVLRSDVPFDYDARATEHLRIVIYLVRVFADPVSGRPQNGRPSTTNGTR